MSHLTHQSLVKMRECFVKTLREEMMNINNLTYTLGKVGQVGCIYCNSITDIDYIVKRTSLTSPHYPKHALCEYQPSSLGSVPLTSLSPKTTHNHLISLPHQANPGCKYANKKLG